MPYSAEVWSKWSAENRDELLEKKRIYYRENRDEVQARNRDRTEFSTKSGKSKALMQAEVILPPEFFGEETA